MFILITPAEVRGGMDSTSEAGAVAAAVGGLTEQVAAVRAAVGGSAAAPSDVAVGVADVSVLFCILFVFFKDVGCRSIVFW